MPDDQSPLIHALPPASDYLTYLTIVEYNLTPPNLPILHDVLQDEKLTTNIGWDLVHLLVPLLPDSEQCLRDIARLGNPREVILKVTDSVRLIEYEERDDGPDHADEALSGLTDSRVRAESSTWPIKTAPSVEDEQSARQMVELPPPLPLPVNQFIALLSMLSILHPRVKTKYPSRFLSSTLQAILASFSKATTHKEEMVQAIVSTIKSVHGVQRPTLPSRKSSGMINTMTTASSSTTSAADPEGPSDVETSAEEKAMIVKLLQSFMTHVIEEYMLTLPSEEDVPGLAWCSRLMERLHPERNIPGKETLTERFQNHARLHRRVDALGQLVTLAQDLHLHDDDALLAAATEVEKTTDTEQAEDDPPTSANDIPLSRFGSVMLYAARHVSAVLYDKPRDTISEPFDIFPDHREILRTCLSSPDQGTGALGTEPESLLDAVLALGIACVERNHIGEPTADEQFNEYLQITALLSSNSPSPNLRGHAHYLTTTVLRSQPDESARLAFIRDTLEHCPFENLKAVAVGWIKGEIIEADPSLSHPTHGDPSSSIFATPLALDALAPSLFPSSLPTDLLTAPLPDAWLAFQSNLSFSLASLNFMYLLLSAEHLHQRLGVLDLWKDNDIAASFLSPLREAVGRFRREMEVGGGLEGEVAASVELNVVEETVGRVERAVNAVV
ncbi:DUF1760-domain-containing protein [Teratosphaeria nubilosa]|uniref:DUF1760-domain-containing protein n=1 Tax=Teratosphaeria nubilosa TaxID=161662 RepID=A0A6G1LJF2_9PEZI|nr:DUF1760-domain-containing protein [Teratosphaeria nubilosa]